MTPQQLHFIEIGGGEEMEFLTAFLQELKRRNKTTRERVPCWRASRYKTMYELKDPTNLFTVRIIQTGSEQYTFMINGFIVCAAQCPSLEKALTLAERISIGYIKRALSSLQAFVAQKDRAP